MRRLAVVALCLALVGCGGDDDIEPIRDALDRPGVPGTGGGGNNDNPSVPTPDSDSLWEYSQVGSSRFAEIRSLNTVATSNNFNDALMQIRLQSFTASNGEVSLSITVAVFFADTACDVSCNLRLKKNGTTGDVYTVRETSESLLTNDSFSARDLRSIIKAVQVSSNASLTLPLTDVPEAEFFFDFSGYDTKFMR
ncbi:MULTISPECIES: hypothetical protein [unclassified Psychrobacter]|uniref:hypothetical protein n=1 Tax=unclassified Psychrobacter TaxID=196806 RepID=UPI003FD53775